MNSQKILLCLFLVFLVAGSATGVKNVLFYETKATYKTDGEYSKFKEALEKRGYVVSKLEIELNKEILQKNNPDVLVLPGLTSTLTPTEKAAVFEFVMQNGKGLFISGGTTAANELSIPFGMTIDDAPLEDETDAIEGVVEEFSLEYADNFVPSPQTKSIVQGVTQLGFFGGNGISLSGNAEAIVVGDRDTYAPKSSTGMFPKGSKPPIAAATIVGNGLVFLLSDGSMLSDSNLEKYSYDNLKFGANIVDWLSISLESTQNASLDELRVIIGNLQQENSRLNDTIAELRREKNKLTQEKATLNSKLKASQEEISNMKKQRFLGLKHWMWALIFIAVSIIILSVVVAKKVKELPGKEKISQLGYEFEGEEGEEEEDMEGPLDIGGGKFEEEDFLGEEIGEPREEGKEEKG